MGCSGHLQALRNVAFAAKKVGVISLVFFTCAIACVVAIGMIVKGDNKVAELKETKQ